MARIFPCPRSKLEYVHIDSHSRGRCFDLRILTPSYEVRLILDVAYEQSLPCKQHLPWPTYRESMAVGQIILMAPCVKRDALTRSFLGLNIQNVHFLSS